jgi:hypothetical protein
MERAVPKGLTSTRLRLHLDESEILLGMSLERMLEDQTSVISSKLWLSQSYGSDTATITILD